MLTTAPLQPVLSTLLTQVDHAIPTPTSTLTQQVFPAIPSSTEIMLHGLLAATLYGLLGIILMLVGFKLFDAITPRIDVQKELAENKNIALAIVVAAMLIALAMMLGRVISA